MKKVIEDQNVFINEVMIRQEDNYGIQRGISYIKDELFKNPLKTIYWKEEKGGNRFSCMVMG